MSTIFRLVCLVVLLTLMQQCWRTAGQTAYNEDQLRAYSRLCQQLRNEMYEKRTAVLARIGTLSQRLQEVQAEVSADEASAIELLEGMKLRSDDVGAATNRIYTPVVKVAPPHPYTDKYQPILTNVIIDHSMGYSGSDGTVTFTKGGIYSMEYKMQSSPYSTFYSTTKVAGADGVTKYTFDYYIDYEVTPFFEMLKIEAGDRLTVESLDESSVWGASASSVATGTFPKTWLVLRFLGEATAATTTGTVQAGAGSLLG